VSVIDTYVVRFNLQGSRVLWDGPTRQEFKLADLTSQPWNGFDDNWSTAVCANGGVVLASSP
jgi:hypothetical protein